MSIMSKIVDESQLGNSSLKLISKPTCVSNGHLNNREYATFGHENHWCAISRAKFGNFGKKVELTSTVSCISFTLGGA